MKKCLQCGQGLPGSAIAAAAAMAIEGTVQEFSHRLLSQRERNRVDQVVTLASSYIDEQMRLGRELRSDQFFEGGPGHRSIADEITEGVLLVAQRQYQEKKLPYIAYLYGNIAFIQMSADFANQAVRLADRLSYRQLCLLSLFGADTPYRLRQEDYRGAGSQSNELWSLMGDIKEMADLGVLGTGGSALLGITDLEPAKIRVQGVGSELYRFMELWRIPAEDVKTLVAMLR